MREVEIREMKPNTLAITDALHLGRNVGRFKVRALAIQLIFSGFSIFCRALRKRKASSNPPLPK
jgi:hypothetical protein